MATLDQPGRGDDPGLGQGDRHVGDVADLQADRDRVVRADVARNPPGVATAGFGSAARPLGLRSQITPYTAPPNTSSTTMPMIGQRSRLTGIAADRRACAGGRR